MSEPEQQERTITINVSFPSDVSEKHVEEYIRGYIRADGWGESFASNYIHVDGFTFSRPIPHSSATAPAQCQHWKDARNLKSDFRDQITEFNTLLRSSLRVSASCSFSHTALIPMYVMIRCCLPARALP